MGINLSATLEEALAIAVKQRQRDQWLAENKTAIAAYNQHAEKNNVFSDGLRDF